MGNELGKVYFDKIFELTQIEKLADYLTKV